MRSNWAVKSGSGGCGSESAASFELVDFRLLTLSSDWGCLAATGTGLTDSEGFDVAAAAGFAVDSTVFVEVFPGRLDGVSDLFPLSGLLVPCIVVLGLLLGFDSDAIGGMLEDPMGGSC